ncbi:MAG: hypothetical protein N3A58_03675 [Spirochaetes bacterium]|nr:hypothetical protein [Spirochaetota bacterium]
MILEILKFIFNYIKIFYRNLIKRVKITKNFTKVDINGKILKNFIFINLIDKINLKKNLSNLFLLNEEYLINDVFNPNHYSSNKNFDSIKSIKLDKSFNNILEYIENFYKNKLEIYKNPKTNEFIFSVKYNSKTDKIYGLGLKFSNFNRKRKVFDNFNTDNFFHSYFSDHLYSTSNIFYLVNKNFTILFIIDFPGFIRYDFGRSQKDKINILIPSDNFNILISIHQNLYDAIKTLYLIQKDFYKPPFHAFGYTHSRWGLKSLDEVKEILESHLKEDFPISNICLDIDYMEDYKNFTISDRFGNEMKFKQFIDYAYSKNIFIIPIIDAGIKDGSIESQKLLESGAYIKTIEGQPFKGKVWPGYCIFFDFTNQKAQILWKDLIKNWCEYSKTYDCWLDMNEPSVFSSENKTLPKKTITSDGIEEKLVHNIYPYFQAKSTLEAYIEKGKRPMLFSRAGYTFQGRFSGNWTGDNRSCFKHLKIGFQQIISLSLCGTMFSGTDIGGFWGKLNNKLLIDWFKASLFHPLYRNHSSIFSKRREIFIFDHKTKEQLRKIINLRYKFLPSIYSLYMESTFYKRPYLQPLLSFYNSYYEIFENRILFKLSEKLIDEIFENIVLIGETFLFDPFNLFDKFNKLKSYFLEKYNFDEFNIDDIKIYIKKGKGLILTENIKQVKNIFEIENFFSIGNPDKNGQYEAIIYLDDGISSKSVDKFGLYKLLFYFNNKGQPINSSYEIIYENLDKDYLILKDKILSKIYENFLNNNRNIKK